MDTKEAHDRRSAAARVLAMHGALKPAQTISCKQVAPAMRHVCLFDPVFALEIYESDGAEHGRFTRAAVHDVGYLKNAALFMCGSLGYAFRNMRGVPTHTKPTQP